jgi:hypothetical protein
MPAMIPMTSSVTEMISDEPAPASAARQVAK